MSQSRRHSLLEAVANTISGFLMGVALNYYLLPLYGLTVNVAQSLSFTLIFTIATTIRSYFWRRLFNRQRTA